jgi:hypothetical protein
MKPGRVIQVSVERASLPIFLLTFLRVRNANQNQEAKVEI